MVVTSQCLGGLVGSVSIIGKLGYLYIAHRCEMTIFILLRLRLSVYDLQPLSSPRAGLQIEYFPLVILQKSYETVHKLVFWANFAHFQYKNERW